MKIAEKEFNIYANKRPKVLLLGNGLCRAYGGMSWDRLLDEIKDNQAFPHPASYYMLPMPLKAALLANNRLAHKLRQVVAESQTNLEQSQRTTWRNFVFTTEQMRSQICRLVNCNFDYVLTTNYSYEIEASLLGEEKLSPPQIAKLMNYHEVDNAQTQFLINTFNQVGEIPIWHIHGEARKPDSMILGHYYYGKLLRRCVARLDGTKEILEDKKLVYHGKEKEFIRNIKVKRPQKIGSWIDAFVLGDVYILGFGMDFSEADLWWLIEYKRNHLEFCGETIFFDPEKDNTTKCEYDSATPCSKLDRHIRTNQCRNLLLKETYGVHTETLGITIQNSQDYRTFYSTAIESMTKGE
jgi:hypothetical protein